MWFVVLGVILIIMKLAEFGPPAGWSWVWVLSPFAAAFVWWIYADMSGLTKRRAMAKMDAKKEDRRRKQLASMGLAVKTTRRDRAEDRLRTQTAQKREKEVKKRREEHSKTIHDSVFDSRTSSFIDAEREDQVGQDTRPQAQSPAPPPGPAPKRS